MLTIFSVLILCVISESTISLLKTLQLLVSLSDRLTFLLLLIKLTQSIGRLLLIEQERTMKLLNKLRELRSQQALHIDTKSSGYQNEVVGLGTVTVHDIVRLHAEMDIYERLYQQRVDH